MQLLGRARLMDELTADGLEVALPVRDCGIDLLVYREPVYRGPAVPARCFDAVPIRVIASSGGALIANVRSDEWLNLLCVCVCGVATRGPAHTYALTRSDMRTVMETRAGHTEGSRSATTTGRSAEIRLDLMAPFLMQRGTWRRKLATLGMGDADGRREDTLNG